MSKLSINSPGKRSLFGMLICEVCLHSSSLTSFRSLDKYHLRREPLHFYCIKQHYTIPLVTLFLTRYFAQYPSSDIILNCTDVYYLCLPIISSLKPECLFIWYNAVAPELLCYFVEWINKLAEITKILTGIWNIVIKFELNFKSANSLLLFTY